MFKPAILAVTAAFLVVAEHDVTVSTPNRDMEVVFNGNSGSFKVGPCFEVVGGDRDDHTKMNCGLLDGPPYR
jgi:hypothetical protein